MSKELTIEDFYIKEWTKNCPKCGRLQIYTRKDKLLRAKRNTLTCRGCASKGRTHSDATKRKMSELNKGNCNPFFGRPLSEEHKCKIRIAKCDRFQQLGIAACSDKGASEWFQTMKELGYNFIEGYYLKEQGYYADGYDKEKNIWMEYDTPYHKQPKWKQKDLIRQQNIIKHFEDIGNPLNEFVRVDVTRPDRMGIEIVYRGKKN